VKPVTMNRPRTLQEGVMLIEALIGILIFSIGILALLGMQGLAIKTTTDTRYRSEAAFLINQITSQMWVDTANLALYTTSGYAPRDNWVSNVAATLPGVDVAGGVRVPTITAAAGNEYTVTVQWLQPGEAQGRTLQMVYRINCATC
jgi:type IV pilus assembly protein PilV